MRVTAAIQDPKYSVNPSKPEVWLRRFMKIHNIDYVKDSYLEGIQFTQDETIDVSLKHGLWLLKLQGVTLQQMQQSLELHRKVLREWSSNSNAIRFHKQRMQLQIPHNLVTHPQSNVSTHGNTILIFRHTSQKKLQESVHSNYSSYLKRANIRYLPTQEWYQKTSADPFKMQDNIHRWIQQEANQLIRKPLPTLSHSYPVQEFTGNRSTFRRRKILKCHRSMHWLNTSRLSHMYEQLQPHQRWTFSVSGQMPER